MGFDVDCEFDQCWYKGNLDRYDEYDPDAVCTFVVNSTSSDNLCGEGFDVAYDEPPYCMALCDTCQYKVKYDGSCQICERGMFDAWITTKGGTVCRECVDFDDIKHIFEKPYIDENLHKCDRQDDVMNCLLAFRSKSCLPFNHKDKSFGWQPYTKKKMDRISADVVKFIDWGIRGVVENKWSERQERMKQREKQKKKKIKKCTEDVMKCFNELTRDDALEMVNGLDRTWRDDGDLDAEYSASQIFKWLYEGRR